MALVQLTSGSLPTTEKLANSIRKVRCSTVERAHSLVRWGCTRKALFHRATGPLLRTLGQEPIDDISGDINPTAGTRRA